MYYIYFNNNKVVLTDNKVFLQKYKYFLLEDISMQDIEKYLKGKKRKKMFVYHPIKEEIMPIFKQKVEVIRAGGGVVRNQKDDFLFIKRKGKWDLPKGKIEEGENIEECAIREVMEETGIKDLKITEFRDITYHIFKRHNKYLLKETHWFNMYSEYMGEFSPQIEEGIEKVKWKSVYKVPKVLTNTYPNIVMLIIG